MLLFMLKFFMEMRVMLLSFWLGPAEQLPSREGGISSPGKRGREVSLRWRAPLSPVSRLAGRIKEQFGSGCQGLSYLLALQL